MSSIAVFFIESDLFTTPDQRRAIHLSGHAVDMHALIADLVRYDLNYREAHGLEANAIPPAKSIAFDTFDWKKRYGHELAGRVVSLLQLGYWTTHETTNGQRQTTYNRALI